MTKPRGDLNWGSQLDSRCKEIPLATGRPGGVLKLLLDGGRVAQEASAELSGFIRPVSATPTLPVKFTGEDIGAASSNRSRWMEAYFWTLLKIRRKKTV